MPRENSDAHQNLSGPRADAQSDADDRYRVSVDHLFYGWHGINNEERLQACYIIKSPTVNEGVACGRRGQCNQHVLSYTALDICIYNYWTAVYKRLNLQINDSKCDDVIFSPL